MQKLTESQVAAAADRWHAGESTVRIARELGVARNTLSRRLKSIGVPVYKRVKRGEQAPGYKNGRHLTGAGYVRVLMQPDHPYAAMRIKTGGVLEHRLVMAEAIGRSLEPYETVHHINGDITDNRLENLQLRFGRHGKGSTFRCRDCGSHSIEPVEI